MPKVNLLSLTPWSVLDWKYGAKNPTKQITPSHFRIRMVVQAVNLREANMDLKVSQFQPHSSRTTRSCGGGPAFNHTDADLRPHDKRQDILTYQTTPLEGPLEVTGNPEVELFASSSAPEKVIVSSSTSPAPIFRTTIAIHNTASDQNADATLVVADQAIHFGGVSASKLTVPTLR